jgi:hypothetical protein
MNPVRLALFWGVLSLGVAYIGRRLFPRVRREWVWSAAAAGSAAVLSGLLALKFWFSYLR